MNTGTILPVGAEFDDQRIDITVGDTNRSCVAYLALPKQEGDNRIAVVVGYDPDAASPFVVWWLGADGGCFQGDYTDNFETAIDRAYLRWTRSKKS